MATRSRKRKAALSPELMARVAELDVQIEDLRRRMLAEAGAGATG